MGESMIYRGHVKNGAIELSDALKLPEGTVVNVEPVESSEPADASELPSLYERLKDVIGIVDGLPPDFAENHDHYIHGTAKK